MAGKRTLGIIVHNEVNCEGRKMYILTAYSLHHRIILDSWLLWVAAA